MGNRKSFWMFVFAAVFALSAAWIADKWIVDTRLAPLDAAKDSEQVVVASVQIDFGQRIEPAQLKVVQMPAGTAPSGVFHSVEEVQEKVALQNIYAGDLVLEKKVRDHLGGSTLAAVISPGMRAVTVRVNDVIGVAGFLLPGNRVDVVATQKDREKTTSTTLLHDVKVLAVDQTASPEKDKPVIVRAVTLELSPKEGERLIKATVEGTVQLTLRNPMEDNPGLDGAEESPKIAANVPPAKPAAADSWGITLIRGTKIEKAELLP